ncbi:DUF4912 domain-containing protein [Alkalihalophilus pseudofirmus]|uniref:DUF4912 domain-containing protein n=1 Tax=Alkalihalophilus pseudofirmus TaxID=79885 RepID=UPI000950C678|nr:DUF4912 domain-containing protein [Alkalihalophilus pseudofirmus]
MIQDILALREKGFSFRKIAKELETTVGKVQYCFKKYQEELQQEGSEDTNQMDDAALIPEIDEKAIEEEKGKKIETEKPVEVIKEVPVHPLPAAYERDEVMLMPRTPNSLYVYWETRESTRRMIEHQFRAPWHELKKAIRLYDVTALLFNGHNAHRFIDYDLPEMTNNWYFHGLTENRTFIVDLGIKTKAGTFFSILRSNPIDTPRVKEGMEGQYVDAVHKWQTGQSQEPEWLEHFSTYSYYESTK